MSFDELLHEVTKFKFQEKRVQEENHFEAVVAVADLGTLTGVLDAYFQAPFKPKGLPPSKEANVYSEPYGGVQAGQTLYYRKDEKGAALALLWPWGGGAFVTLKIIHK